MKIALGALILFILPSVGDVALAGESDTLEKPVISLSIVSILAEPDGANGYAIELSGYLANEYKPHLYLTKEFADLMDHQTAVPIETVVDLRSTKCMHKYVQISGEYGEVSLGRYGFTKIYTITPIPADGDFWSDCYTDSASQSEESD